MTTLDNAQAKGWDRSAVTFRLSAKRVNDLKILCDDEQLSPTAALDLAIGLAKDAKDDHKSDSSSAETSKVQDLIAAQAAHAHRTEELLTVMAQQIHELKTTITNVANASDLVSSQWLGPDAPKSSVLSLRSWLDREAFRSTQSVMVVRAQWQGMKRLGNERMQFDLIVGRMIDASSDRDARPETMPVFFVTPAQPSILSGIASTQSIYLKCQQQAEKNQWQLSVHHVADGKLGRALFMLRV